MLFINAVLTVFFSSAVRIQIQKWLIRVVVYGFFDFVSPPTSCVESALKLSWVDVERSPQYRPETNRKDQVDLTIEL